MTSAIETSGLTRHFGHTEAVDGLTLQVPVGGIFALIGPNGAGKTTTLKLLMNLLRPTRGSARVLGTDSRALGPSDLQRIGYVSENQRLPDWLSPREILAYCKPFYPTWDEDLARALAGRLGLSTRAPLRTLSRGTRMKTALLSSLAYRPDLLVMDEPFSGLDPLVRDELAESLLERPGSTVVISSHDIEEVARLADGIGFILGGRLLFAESTSSLLARFRQVEVTGDEVTSTSLPGDRRWISPGVSGRTLRFVDSQAGPESAAQFASVFPSAEIRIAPLPLREIFVTLARHAAAGTGDSRP